MPSKPRRTGGTRERRSSGTTDLLRLYLQDIGRVDLLTNEEEVTLARLVQRREALLLQQRELAESDAAIGELHRLEEMQRREANQHSHWPTKQEWARAAGLPLPELQQRIDLGYQAWAEQIPKGISAFVAPRPTARNPEVGLHKAAFAQQAPTDRGDP